MPTHDAVRKQAEVYLAPFVSAVESGGWELPPLVLCAITLHRTGGVKRLLQRIEELETQIAECAKSSSVSGIEKSLTPLVEELRQQVPASERAESRLADAGWIFDPEAGTITGKNVSGRGHAPRRLATFCVESLYDVFVPRGERGKNTKAFRSEILARLIDYFPGLDDEAIRQAIDGQKRRRRSV